jgi:hypothetical protein
MFCKQAENTLLMARSKLELLRMSLDARLSELPASSSVSKMEIVRQELDQANGTIQNQRYSAVAKTAALTGKLNIRQVAFTMHIAS